MLHEKRQLEDKIRSLVKNKNDKEAPKEEEKQ